MKSRNRSAEPTIASSPTASRPAISARSTPKSDPTHEEIAACARSLWESKGFPKDQDQEIWLEAERRLKNVVPLDKVIDAKAFADPKRLVDRDGDPAGRIDRRLNAVAAPAADRSATSL